MTINEFIRKLLCEPRRSHSYCFDSCLWSTFFASLSSASVKHPKEAAGNALENDVDDGEPVGDRANVVESLPGDLVLGRLSGPNLGHGIAPKDIHNDEQNVDDKKLKSRNN